MTPRLKFVLAAIVATGSGVLKGTPGPEWAEAINKHLHCNVWEGVPTIIVNGREGSYVEQAEVDLTVARLCLLAGQIGDLAASTAANDLLAA